MVFCLIDDLSNLLYNGEEEKHARKIFDWLVELTKARRRNNCTFKALITATNHLGVHIPVEDGDVKVLHVPQNLPRGGGFTDLQWEMGTGRLI